jgi:hypothetical protein
MRLEEILVSDLISYLYTFPLLFIDNICPRSSEIESLTEILNKSQNFMDKGCETWSLTLREERRLRVFENRVLRRIFGPKRDEVTGEWRKLHNDELRDLYSSPSIIRIIKLRRMRWADHVERMEGRGTRIGYWWESQRERDH